MSGRITVIRLHVLVIKYVEKQTEVQVLLSTADISAIIINAICWSEKQWQIERDTG